MVISGLVEPYPRVWYGCMFYMERSLTGIYIYFTADITALWLGCSMKIIQVSLLQQMDGGEGMLGCNCTFTDIDCV